LAEDNERMAMDFKAISPKNDFYRTLQQKMLRPEEEWELQDVIRR
jgi:hypothetical protein